MNDTASAARTVRKAERKPLSTDERMVLPDRISSFNRSKYTTYESTVIPIDTMMPITPDRSRARPLLWPRYDTIAHSRAAVRASPATTIIPRAR